MKIVRMILKCGSYKIVSDSGMSGSGHFPSLQMLDLAAAKASIAFPCGPASSLRIRTHLVQLR